MSATCSAYSVCARHLAPNASTSSFINFMSGGLDDGASSTNKDVVAKYKIENYKLNGWSTTVEQKREGAEQRKIEDLDF